MSVDRVAGDCDRAGAEAHLDSVLRDHRDIAGTYNGVTRDDARGDAVDRQGTATTVVGDSVLLIPGDGHADRVDRRDIRPVRLDVDTETVLRAVQRRVLHVQHGSAVDRPRCV